MMEDKVDIEKIYNNVPRFPRLRKHQKYYRNFKEGGYIDEYAEYIMQISTNMNGWIFSEMFTWNEQQSKHGINGLEAEVWVENMLKEKVRENIKNTYLFKVQ